MNGLREGLTRLVLHADDFGMNRAVTDGIIRGFTHGLLTSASLLANAPDAARSCALWRDLEHQRTTGGLPSAVERRILHEIDGPFDLGIHLNLTQGMPLTADGYPEELLNRDGNFCGIGRLFRYLHRRRRRFEAAILAELCAQVEFLCDRGLSPSHLNGHQYIELLPGLAHVIPALLKRYGIGCVRVAREPGLTRTALLHAGIRPWILAQIKRFYADRFCAGIDRLGPSHPDAFFGTAHAGRIDPAVMQRFLAASPDGGLVEIGLHPAAELTGGTADGAWYDPLEAFRPCELDLLVSRKLCDLLQRHGMQLARLANTCDAAAVAAA